VTTPAQETVLRLFDAFAARDVDAALALAHPGIELWGQPTGEQIGRTEPYRGHDGVREDFADAGRAWERLEVDPGDFRVARTAAEATRMAAGGAPDDDQETS
jgi:ketosteroid isomerase-like protein